MSDIEALRAFVNDSFGRAAELVEQLTADLSPEQMTYRPDAEANPVSWLIWHATRVQDDHVADLAQVDQVWPRWRDRFDLPFDDWATGYGQSADEVGKVRVGGDLLAGYHHDVQQLTKTYVDRLSEQELERIVDTHWDPPVSASVRLVSVIGDVTQHLGQAAYVGGLARRAQTS